jgi:hypothetical protein
MTRIDLFWRGILVTALMVFCTKCSTVNESRLVGIYHANGSCVTITLVVNPDHSFVQSARAAAGETNRLTGRWSVDKKDKMMTFEPFLDFLNDEHGKRLGFANFPPEVIWPAIEMGSVVVKCPDSYHEIRYVK